MHRTDENGNKVLQMPITTAENVEGLGKLATQDSAIKDLSISGTTITLTNTDNSKKTLNTQDTNNHYVPNYSAIVTCSLPTNTMQTYTAPSDGYIVIQIYGYWGGNAEVSVNDVVLLSGSGLNDEILNNMTAVFPVSKGDVIKYICVLLDTGIYPRRCCFIPAKTV